MISETIRSGDWKGEKHVPVIEYEREGELVKVKVQVGKEIPHPNTTEHHIRYIELYFLPEGENFVYQVGRVEFTAHGESVNGPNTSDVYTEPIAYFVLKTKKKGKLYALSYCNIHGLWENEVTLE
ncbi:superoxide reductase [Pyrococcus furiosus DSM 3638]|uniref:Superoxide reductase n=3 Tax=Pyrococcus furiosus TaxID=2261 RepID=SOR_PYRFU|nr:superoxide reductase SorA [Pyrococcus furiosus]P82385.1 RecName: Full=Superoxide reductase; Short=SOR [Pyrococcus furiosus DSM 3638]1DO6_A Chain A, Superoxide Reductase [Pyrococcus furiosus]1DO6_B Chain B, Superoxide Reductase [Pyrococcus furiosus]1DQI_A Chain A, SUPEROXIDE REDUCTASE [Pyrococcus furiosus]1DQI_B Chain B, SUPEROXIDE REDUCTASE [Pyrococcus furiosus]1DQI_C Chain C, SUPEROXIDE REDUCTASE [Pyrococcus furiosus]1DQI_D Chain D, SUPEROXIDE REDUCTASE [Pyrococcus furiosus]1DQK_A Chain